MRVAIWAIRVLALTACSSNDPDPQTTADRAIDELVVQATIVNRETPIEGVRVQVNELPWSTTDAAGDPKGWKSMRTQSSSNFRSRGFSSKRRSPAR
jgi:hypothetical protein